MRKSSGMRDFSNFLKDGKQMGEWSSIKQSSGSRAWNVHRGGTGGENCVTVLNSLGLRSPRTDKERNGAWDEKHLLKSCRPSLQLHFQGRKKEKGRGQWHLSQNFSSGHLFMSHRTELRNVMIPGCKRGWQKNWVGYLAIPNKIRENWAKQQVGSSCWVGLRNGCRCRRARHCPGHPLVLPGAGAKCWLLIVSHLRCSFPHTQAASLTWSI